MKLKKIPTIAWMVLFQIIILLGIFIYSQIQSYQYMKDAIAEVGKDIQDAQLYVGNMCEKEDAYFSEKELQCVSLYQKEYVCIQQVNDSDVCKMRTEVEVLKPRLE